MESFLVLLNCLIYGSFYLSQQRLLKFEKDAEYVISMETPRSNICVCLKISFSRFFIVVLPSLVSFKFQYLCRL